MDTALLEWVSNFAVGAYTTPNHAQIVQTTSSLALWRTTSLQPKK